MNTAGDAHHGDCMQSPAGSGTIRVKRKLNSADVIDALSELFILRGIPAYIRSDNVLCREFPAA